MPLLSIYMPIYNHSKIIKENLDFLAQEIRTVGEIEDIEVVISDNASTDCTEEKVKNFIDENRDLNVVYSRNKEDIGGIKNIAHLWNKTKGDYVIMVGDDCFAKSGLVNIYSSLKENPTADILLIKNNTYTDFEYNRDATVSDVIRHVQKLQYIGSFVLSRKHFGLDFYDCDIDYSNHYPHLIMVLRKISGAKKVIDTRFVAININISWDYNKTVKIIYKLGIDCLKIAKGVRGEVGEENYKMMVKILNKSLYRNLRFIRTYKSRFLLLCYIWNEIPIKNAKVIISLLLHCMPAPLFYFIKVIESVIKNIKSCAQEILQNRVKWKNKSVMESQDHIADTMF